MTRPLSDAYDALRDAGRAVTAARLREAAALMRERAEAATPGPWRFSDSEAVNDVWDGGMVVVSGDADPIANVQDEWYENDPVEPAPVNDAAHIASWHPAVALVVAGWLDACALVCEIKPDATKAHALAVANAYLGQP